MINEVENFENYRFLGKKVLVTGGAGFVGSNLVKKLVDEKAEVIILDDFFTGSLDNLKNIAGKYEVIEGSVADRECVNAVTKRVDMVFHLAARNIIASTRNPYDDFETNIKGTLNVLLAAREYQTSKVIYSSSASVYGNPTYLPINEDDHISLLTPYAVSKYSGEGYCSAFHESYDLPITVVRYSNIYGIGQDPKNPYCGVIAKFMEAALSGIPIKIHGDGQQTRDFTYVDDAVEATILLSLSTKAEGEVFNIGTGTETTINQLASKVIELFDVKEKPIYADRRDIDNIRRRVVNIEKIRRKVKWIPKVILDEGLMRTKVWLISRDHS